MFRFITSVVAVCCLGLLASNLFAVTFDWAVVGYAGNAPDQLYVGDNNPNNLQFGAVDYTYRISKHEVTNDQYAGFLNAVADSDPNGLFHSGMEVTQSGTDGSFSYRTNLGFERHPVVCVSFFNAMRFVNWLENGQPTGEQGPDTTEVGVYTIGTGLDETRAPGATYFIPSEDEWYKAAYYDPRLEAAGGPPGDDNYWLYPTRNDSRLTAEVPPGGTNSANYDSVVNATTDVGAYPGTTGFYGTFDQGGNVSEWNEAVNSFFLPGWRGLRGSSWAQELISMAASARDGGGDPWREYHHVGFRVASIAAILAGDMNGDYLVNFQDLTPFVLGMTDILAYEAAFPELTDSRVERGDINQDSLFNLGDLTPFANLLTAPATGTAIPEPTTWVMCAMFCASTTAATAQQVLPCIAPKLTTGPHRSVF